MSSSLLLSLSSRRSLWLYCTVLFTIGGGAGGGSGGGVGGGSLIATVSAADSAAVTIPACDLAELFTAKRVSVEEVGIASAVVFRGLSTSDSGEPVVATDSSRRSTATAATVTPNNSNQIQDGIFTAYFELINTYKGAELLDVWDAYNFRRLNVTIAIRAGLVCKQAIVTTPVEYIVFCTLVRGQLHATSVATWDEYADQRLWMALGWSSWSDWSGCSVSCSAGIQQRTRHCRLKTCPGFNVEQRHCNLFSCYDSVSPLTAGDQQHTGGDSAVAAGYYFHPSRDQWTRVPDRPSAWRLRPNSYIWLPSSQLFAKTNNSDVVVTGSAATSGDPATAITTPSNANAAPFPREFALFVTLRLLNNSFGTVFSLRSRRRQDTYLSLEAAGSDIKVIHAAVNGTDVLRIPAHLDDGNWHQVALSIRDDSVIDTYIDCEWSRTDILRKGSLDIPDDSDLIIGYLFEGDLDQMTIVPDPSVVSLQCSNDITPIMDPSVQDVRELQTKTTTGTEEEEATRTTRTTTTTTSSPILLRLSSTLDYIGGETVDEAQVKEQPDAAAAL